jgi:hypothetical protein
MLPDNTTAFSLILNVGVPEFVDLCAISANGQIRRVTNEHGFRILRIDATRPLPDGVNIPAIIRVTSSNAIPTERRVVFLGNVIPDEHNQGVIVEFPPEDTQRLVPQGGGNASTGSKT